MGQETTLLLQDLQRSFESNDWLCSMGYPSSTRAWSWTLATVQEDIIRTVRAIKAAGGLLLIGGIL